MRETTLVSPPYLALRFKGAQVSYQSLMTAMDQLGYSKAVQRMILLYAQDHEMKSIVRCAEILKQGPNGLTTLRKE